MKEAPRGGEQVGGTFRVRSRFDRAVASGRVRVQQGDRVSKEI